MADTYKPIAPTLSRSWPSGGLGAARVETTTEDRESARSSSKERHRSRSIDNVLPQICRSSGACLRLEKSLGGSSTRRSITESTIRQRVAEGKSLRFDHPLGSKVIADACTAYCSTVPLDKPCRHCGTRSYLVRTFAVSTRQSTTGGSPDTPCSSDNDTLYSTLALSHCKMLSSTWSTHVAPHIR
jgi:hypothetical protein